MAIETETRQAIVQPDGSVKIPAEVLERAGIKPGDELYFWTTGRNDLNAVMLPKLTLEEMIEQFGDSTITEIDWPKLQAEIEEAMAQDCIDEMRRNG